MKVQRRSKRAGVAMIMSLLFTALLVATVAVVASQQQIQGQARINKVNEMNARNAAESGLQLAITTLASQSSTATTLNDQWANLGGTPTQPGSITYDVGSDSFRIQIVDACSLIDLNTASQAQLQMLPLTQAQVDSLIDWRQQGQTAQADGAKDDFYQSLPNPYLTKLGRIDSLNELLLIDNFTPATLYDTPDQLGVTTQLTSSTSDTNNFSLASLCTVDALSSNSSSGSGTNGGGSSGTGGNGGTGSSGGTGGGAGGTGGAGGAGGANSGGKINVNSSNFSIQTLEQKGIPGNLANEIYRQRPIKTLGQLISLPGVNAQNAVTLLNDLTTTSATTLEGKINLNTASETVLTSLPGMTTTLAQQILTQQANGFTDLGSLLSVSGITPQLASQFIDDLCTSSETFIVRIIGKSGSTTYPLIATIQLNGTTPKIIKLFSAPFPDMATRWQWYDSQQDIDAVNSTTQTVTTSSGSSASPSGGNQ